MNVGLRSGSRLVRLRPILSGPSTVECERYYSAVPSTTQSTGTPQSHDPLTVPCPKLEHIPYHITSAVVLSRPPQLTRDLSPFEQSFYFYQRRLDARLALPFTRALYYKKGTLAEAEYKRKLKAYQLSDLYYNPYSKTDGFKDELLVGQEPWKKADYGYEELVKYTVTGEESLEKEAKEATDESKKNFERPYPRETEADRTGDKHRLDRKLSRTMYLLVKGALEEGEYGGKNGWRFPMSRLAGRENIRSAAERTLEESAGSNMNTWFVGNIPIGHYSYLYAKPVAGETGEIVGRKIFFVKARIMAGQVDLKNNKHGWKDFAWVTKDEMEELVGERYYYGVRHMLHSR